LVQFCGRRIDPCERRGLAEFAKNPSRLGYMMERLSAPFLDLVQQAENDLGRAQVGRRDILEVEAKRGRRLRRVLLDQFDEFVCSGHQFRVPGRTRLGQILFNDCSTVLRLIRELDLSLAEVLAEQERRGRKPAMSA